MIGHRFDADKLKLCAHLASYGLNMIFQSSTIEDGGFIAVGGAMFLLFLDCSSEPELINNLVFNFVPSELE